MVKRHCTVPFKFACLTEDPTGIHQDIQIIPLPNNLRGWWCKPYMFSKQAGLKGTILYMDLDVVIADNIDKLWTYETKNWCVIRDFTRAQRPDWQKYNSSIIRFRPEQMYFIWEEFARDANKIQRTYWGDQDYLYVVTKNNPAKLWPDSWIQSWKWEIRKDKTLARGNRGDRKLVNVEDVEPPEHCCVTVFHGDPNPHNCDDPWVKANWK
jgi:hypothetical protein